MDVCVFSLSVALLLFLAYHYRDPAKFLARPTSLLRGGHRGSSTKIIHRLLLWDDGFPVRQRPLIWKLLRGREGFHQYLWREADILELLEQYPEYAKTYAGYTKKIQQADFARYLIVCHFGGFYLDHDIKTTQKDLQKITDCYKDQTCVLFEELTWQEGAGAFTQDYRIRQTLDPQKRQEAALRVANYAFFASPGSDVLKRILTQCLLRASCEVLEPYDVLFTTGPDVVSTVVDELSGDEACVVVPRKDADRYFRHLSVHGWYGEVT